MELPNWAVLSILVLLAGLLAWGVYKFWTGSSGSGVEAVEIQPHSGLRSLGSAGLGHLSGYVRNRGNGPSLFQHNAPNELDRNKSGRITLRHGLAEVTIHPAHGKDPVFAEMEYLPAIRRSWLSDQESYLYRTAFYVTSSDAMRKAVQLRPDQQKSIRAKVERAGVPLSVAEQKQLITLAQAWENAAAGAAKTTASEQFKAAAQQIAQAHLKETQTSYRQGLATVQTILTSDQWSRIREWQAATTRPSRPATQPSFARTSTASTNP